MRRSRTAAGMATQGRCVVVVGALALMTAGCSLTSPGCNNRDVRSSIEQDARSSINLWLTTSQSTALPESTRIAVSGNYETARSGNKRSCAAKIQIGELKDAVEVPIEYEVIKADDGQVLYRWDKDTFGKSFIGSAMMSVFSSVLKPRANPKSDEISPQETAPSEEVLPAPDATPKESADAEAANAAAAKMEEWKRSVSATLTARARQLTRMPSGRQRVRFRIGPDGEITTVTAIGKEDSELAKRTVSFLETTDLVPKPPKYEAIWITTSFRF